MTEPGHAIWELGLSERGIAVSERHGSQIRIGIIGPIPSMSSLIPELTDVAEQSLREQLCCTASITDPAATMEAWASAIDCAIRDRLGDGRKDARGTLVLAIVHDGVLHVAHTGHGTAFLFRDGVYETIAPDPGHTTSEWHPWLGSRRTGDEQKPLLLHATLEPCPLRPGDRILLCTAPPPHLITISSFDALVRTGSADVAALSLAHVLEVQLDLTDVAVAVLDWEPSRETSTSTFVDEHLLAGLTDIITEITEEHPATDDTSPDAPDEDLSDLPTDETQRPVMHGGSTTASARPPSSVRHTPPDGPLLVEDIAPMASPPPTPTPAKTLSTRIRRRPRRNRPSLLSSPPPSSSPPPPQPPSPPEEDEPETEPQRVTSPARPPEASGFHRGPLIIALIVLSLLALAVLFTFR